MSRRAFLLNENGLFLQLKLHGLQNVAELLQLKSVSASRILVSRHTGRVQRDVLSPLPRTGSVYRRGVRINLHVVLGRADFQCSCKVFASDIVHLLKISMAWLGRSARCMLDTMGCG